MHKGGYLFRENFVQFSQNRFPTHIYPPNHFSFRYHNPTLFPSLFPFKFLYALPQLFLAFPKNF
nr:MAG TPA: hypothetical protein [Caudoviricetes sp.]